MFEGQDKKKTCSCCRPVAVILSFLSTIISPVAGSCAAAVLSGHIFFQFFLASYLYQLLVSSILHLPKVF